MDIDLDCKQLSKTRCEEDTCDDRSLKCPDYELIIQTTKFEDTCDGSLKCTDYELRRMNRNNNEFRLRGSKASGGSLSFTLRITDSSQYCKGNNELKRSTRSNDFFNYKNDIYC